MPLISPTRKRALFILIGLLGAVFVGIQFVRPTFDNPPVLADLQAPPEVKQILMTSCYNCHSNETKLPWFDKIVPPYWLVVSDVKAGRAHMNFSDFGSMPEAKQAGYLYESVNQMENGVMPPRKYTLLHPEAIVTPGQIAVLKKYLHPAELNPVADAAQIAAADDQYQKWLTAAPASTPVKPTANGLEFFPDYKNWKTVSTTDRFDNHTLRVILGNDVATKAIASGNIHPWPDGAAFAKIAFKQQADANGVVSASEFIQVEFMVKDAQKYAATEGWGFGRWKTVEHTPYGKDASFTEECTSCHAPMRDNDFVFSMPVTNQPQTSDFFNKAATLPNDLPYQPLSWGVIASSVDKAASTMSTLYGNDEAVEHARTNPPGSYPGVANGSVLALVTWRQQEDRHWFGGRIPGVVQSVEFVTVTAPVQGVADEPSHAIYTYEGYEGTPLVKVDGKDAASVQARINVIAGMRASVMP